MTRLPALATALALAVILPADAGEPGSLKPVSLDKLNTAADEDDPCLSPDGTRLYYASNAAGDWDILLSTRSGTAWAPGKPVKEVNKQGSDERSPLLTRDGKFYFATNVIPDEKFKDLKNYDLKVMVGGRAPLPLPGVSEKEDELHPCLAAGGKEFYFSRKTKDGWVLFVARGPTPGPIGDAKAAGFAPGFHRATLSSSSLLMYLEGPLEKGRTGLYRSTRAKAGAAWGKPEPLTTLNHPEGKRGDCSPCLSADGTRLYFASDRPGGKGGLDLWSITTSQLKP